MFAVISILYIIAVVGICLIAAIMPEAFKLIVHYPYVDKVRHFLLYGIFTFVQDSTG